MILLPEDDGRFPVGYVCHVILRHRPTDLVFVFAFAFAFAARGSDYPGASRHTGAIPSPSKTNTARSTLDEHPDRAEDDE